MQLSDGEKLILVMLSEVYKHLKIKGEIDPEFVLSTISNDMAWGFKWKYSGFFNPPEDNPPVVQETCDILDMYRVSHTNQLIRKIISRREKPCPKGCYALC